jgi:asparagine synthase (glutamine-hydrolysing)
MVGLCGAVDDRTPPDAFVDAIAWRDDEVAHRFVDDGLSVFGSFHPLLSGEQPVRARNGEALIWVWGDVYGFGADESYVPRDGPPDGSARYCADLYDQYGMDFVRELNGDFGLVVYDRTAGTVSLVTDRVATRPFFLARPDGGRLVFSSQLQALPLHPDVNPEFEAPHLQEYFQLRRVLGVETPLSGVREVPPGSIATVDLADGSLSVDTYWRPSYEPVDEDFETYLDRFTDTFQTVVQEWTRDDLDYGILLSGGSDSRLVQAAMDQPVTAFHIADWMSREANVASEAADTAGDEFHLLQRDPDHEAAALERNPAISNFSGWFDQAYFTGFDDEISEEVDVLVSGLYADSLFKGSKLDARSLSLGPVGTLKLPFRNPVESVEDYVSLTTTEVVDPVSYLPERPPIDSVIADNIRETRDGVVSHGVEYGSLQDLVLYGDFYPMGADTDATFSRSLMHMRPYRTPFLDNRLLDLQQQVPMRYFLRRDFIDRAVEQLSPELAELPHARTGMPLKHRFPVDWVGGNLKGLWRKHVGDETPPEDHLDHSPWPDRAALVRARNFPVETIVENQEAIRALPFIDYEGALDSYRAHMAGDDESPVLYSLLTFLETPLLDRMTESDDEASERRTVVEQ